MTMLTALCALELKAQSAAVTEILSRPTSSSITLSVLFDQDVQAYVEYGTVSGAFTTATTPQSAVGGTPLTISLAGLLANQRYYYRTCYKKPTAPAYVLGAEHTFHTQRAKGAQFSFTIEADPHPYDKKGSHTLLNIALQNQSKDSADFLIDLGDTFGDDHYPTTITSDEVRQLHLNWRSFFGIACHSSPLFLCLGNHEGESGYYLLQTPPSNLGVYGTVWRKFYFANPIPDGFYSGNSTSEEFGMGLPENYYAWEWGDALFIVLDAYRYYTVSAKPRGWDWTIGKTQYDWLKQTLETSTAKYKFVFAHHTLGETRGGIVTAKLFEWGGYQSDQTTWGFTANRPGWAMPIHQLMVTNGVNIYFQGHDHLFAKEDIDGMVYQQVPMPSDSTYVIGVTDNGSAYPGTIFDGSGHLRVTVAPESVNVAYVESRLPADENSARWNGRIVSSYSIKPNVASTELEFQMPEDCILEQNYPNPFNPTTTVRYQLPGLSEANGSAASRVDLRVFDLLGREVAVLVNEEQMPGTHVITWDATAIPSGIYFYRLTAGPFSFTRKMLLTK